MTNDKKQKLSIESLYFNKLEKVLFNLNLCKKNTRFRKCIIKISKYRLIKIYSKNIETIKVENIFYALIIVN
jgi:hypothetical protein